MTVVENIKNATAMKVLGWLLIVFSVIEFGVGGAVYGFLTNVHLGAWWGAICCFIAGVCGAMSSSRAVVITGLVFSIFAIIVSIVGAIVDGLANAVFAAEDGCTNTETYQFWGTSEGKYWAGVCAYSGYYFYNSYGHEGDAPVAAAKDSLGKTTEAFYNLYYNKPYSNNNNFFYNHPSWRFYYNVNHFYNWYQTHNTYYWDYNHGGNNNNNNNNYYNSYTGNLYSSYGNQCVCSDGTLCYGYDLASGDNCGEILTTYTSLLSASTAFLSLLVVLSFVYSIYTCVACGSSSVTAQPLSVVPTQVQMAPVSAAPGYVQPGMTQPMGYAPVPVGYAAVPQPMGYAPAHSGYAVAPAPVGYAQAPQQQPMMQPLMQPIMQPQQQPVMYAAQPAFATAAPVGYAPVVQAGDTKFV